jgi:hypothetical protein
MELKSIFATGTAHEFGGQSIFIKQISLDDLPHVSELFSKATGKKESTQAKIMSLIASDFPLIKATLVRLTDIKEEDIGKISIATIVFIIAKIVEENATFLTQVVAPMVQETAKSLGGLTKSKS